MNSLGEKIPSLFTPTNPLSKTSVLTVLFNKYCITNGYVPLQSPIPQVSILKGNLKTIFGKYTCIVIKVFIVLLQYLMIFEITNAEVVLSIIEELGPNIINYGFFRSADPENPRLLCKDYELLLKCNMDSIW